MKDFAIGALFATFFFGAIGFTSGDEDKSGDEQQAEYMAYVKGLEDGARQASLRRCDAKAFFTEGMK